MGSIKHGPLLAHWKNCNERLDRIAYLSPLRVSARGGFLCALIIKKPFRINAALAGFDLSFSAGNKNPGLLIELPTIRKAGNDVFDLLLVADNDF